jgi:hypothetical protein
MKKQFALLMALIIFLAACSPSEGAIQTPVAATVAAIPTQTSYPTLTPYPTQTPYPTLTLPPTLTPEVRVVTATFTATPEVTATATQTPGPTQDPLTLDKEAGIYLVGIDIAPGLWRNNGETSKCYWAVSSKTGDIVANHFGAGKGTLYLSKSSFQVQLDEECGTWKYMGK